MYTVTIQIQQRKSTFVHIWVQRTVEHIIYLFYDEKKNCTFSKLKNELCILYKALNCI